jgi:hypothetical protein
MSGPNLTKHLDADSSCAISRFGKSPVRVKVTRKQGDGASACDRFTVAPILPAERRAIGCERPEADMK